MSWHNHDPEERLPRRATKKEKTPVPLPAFNEWALIGRAMAKIQFWAERYDLSFQFWKDGNNNVFIERDLVEIHSMGGEDTPLQIMERTIEWCEKTNPSVKYPAGIEISNPQP